jgi:hypothetical protein
VDELLERRGEVRWALWANLGTVTAGTLTAARVRVMRSLRP